MTFFPHSRGERAAGREQWCGSHGADGCTPAQHPRLPREENPHGWEQGIKLHVPAAGMLLGERDDD